MRFPLARLAPIAFTACLLGAPGCGGKPAPTAPADPGSVFTVRAPLLNLLECPSVTCDVVDDLRDGENVSVLTPDLGGWAEVRVLATGQRGFVQSRFLSRP